MTRRRTTAWIVLVGLLAGPPASAQSRFGGPVPVGGGSIGANPGQNSGPWPAAGDSSAGNTISPAQALGMGQGSTQAASGFGAPDAVVGPNAVPSDPPALPPPPAPRK